jgi:hypothetical protein
MWKRHEKKGIELAMNTLIPWIIMIAVLVIVIIAILYFSGAGKGYIQYLRNLLRFGRS